MTLHGVWGKMTVKGKTYDPSRGVPPMTAFRSLLKDDELAAVLTFVRNTWGNKAPSVKASAVARVRKETSKRDTFWKPEDLLAEHPLEGAAAATAKEFSNDKLEAELMATAPAELAKVAEARGNAARGKKVFYKSAAACFACHDPPKGAAALGPDLAKLKKKITPAQLVDSILRPSDLIDKEFAQVKVLDVDGNVRIGVRISENDKEIVLRNVAEPKPIKIKQGDIESVVESKVSLMPANLARQLKSRKEFDDLMKYIMELRKR